MPAKHILSKLIFNLENGSTKHLCCQPQLYLLFKKLTGQMVSVWYKWIIMKIILSLTAILFTLGLQAQEIESIDFHLYTDSLKKGRYNYINIDAKLSNGRYMPLTQKEVIFKSNTGKWDGNSLIVDSSYSKDSVVISATIKDNPSLTKSVTIYIKKSNDEGKLATESEIFDNRKRKPNH